MEHSPELNHLAKALAEAQAEFTAIPKDSTNPFFKSSYAGLPAVVETASPVLTTHGLSIAQFIGTDEVGDILTTWLLHESGQWLSDSMRLHLKQADPQSQGSAVTYARRYSYMSVLGLVADDDDDGNAATKGVSEPAKTSAKRSGSTRRPPEVVPDALDPETGEIIPAAVTTKQANYIRSLCRGRGITDDQEQVSVVSGMADRKDLKSVTDLTASEASKVIEQLKVAS